MLDFNRWSRPAIDNGNYGFAAAAAVATYFV
jgi:hypothetical protein